VTRNPRHADVTEEFAARETVAISMGGSGKLDRLRAAGRLDARARVDRLFDSGSFTEVGRFAYTGAAPEDAPADGKITGYGRIDGRPAAAVVNDFTVKGASSTVVYGRMIAHVKRIGAQRRIPLVFLGESSGGRIPETMGAAGMGASGGDPAQYVRLRETPWASAVLGPCFGSSTWYACLSDFRVMRRGALLSVSSAQLVRQATGAEVDAETLGGWKLHAEVTGLADRVVDSDEAAIDEVKTFLAYLPSHCGEPALRRAVPAGSGDDMPGILALLPEARTRVYDMRKLVRAIVDRDSLFELKADFGRTVVTALARIDGRSVGIVATNPLHKGAALDAAACQKLTAFVVLCDSFNLPLVNLVDVPGFGIGLEAEQRAMPARIMTHMTAVQLASVPKITVFIRKVYGQAYLNLGGGRNSDEVAAWPTAEVGFMAPAAGATVVHGLRPGDDGYEVRVAEMERETSPWAMAAQFAVQHVIRPQDTRDFLARMLDVHCGERGFVGRHHLRRWPFYV
jgi:acetyl-CoA carboxylase carboxyltransferase component